DLYPSTSPLGSGGAAADHVLIRAADVGADGAQDGAVGHFATDVRGIHPRAVFEFELRIRRVDDLDDTRALVRHSSVPRHLRPFGSRHDHAPPRAPAAQGAP